MHVGCRCGAQFFAVPPEKALVGLLLPLFANSNDRVTPATMRSE